MDKLYVNEIDPDGKVSTLGLFYSQGEAQKIVDMLRGNPERPGYRYEIVEAAGHVRLPDEPRRAHATQKERP